MGMPSNGMMYRPDVYVPRETRLVSVLTEINRHSFSSSNVLCLSKGVQRLARTPPTRSTMPSDDHSRRGTTLKLSAIAERLL